MKAKIEIKNEEEEEEISKIQPLAILNEVITLPEKSSNQLPSTF